MTVHREAESVTLTADVVLFGYRDDIPHVLLVRRGWPPFEGDWALPGGMVEPGERVYDAAFRELEEETGIRVVPHPTERGYRPVLPISTYSDPGRDPRGRYVTQAWTVVLDDAPEPTAGDDATTARWVPVLDLFGPGVMTHGLAFDHGTIFDHAIGAVWDRLRMKITVPKGQRYE